MSLHAMQEALRTIEQYANIPETIPTREALRAAIAGSWKMEAEQKPRPIPFPWGHARTQEMVLEQA